MDSHQTQTMDEFTKCSVELREGPIQIVGSQHQRNPRIIINFQILNKTYYYSKFRSNEVRLDREEHFPTRAQLSSQWSHFKNLTSIRKTIKTFLKNLMFPIDIHKEVATEIYYSMPLYINSRVSRVEFLFEIEVKNYIFCRKESLLWENSMTQVCKEKSETEHCVICLELLVPGVEVRHLPCSHNCFHSKCLSKWVKKNDSCPLCRFTV